MSNIYTSIRRQKSLVISILDYYLVITMDFFLAMEKFIRYAKFVKQMTPEALDYHERRLEKFGNFLREKYKKSKILVSDITLDNVIDFGEYLVDYARKAYNWTIEKKLSYNTRRNYFSTIRCFLKFCYVSDIPSIKWELIPPQNPIPAERQIFSENEISEIFLCPQHEDNELVGVRNELFMRVAYFTGLRSEENLNLTFEKILSGKQFQIKQKG
jgi:site-specific recombinase XerD